MNRSEYNEHKRKGGKYYYRKTLSKEERSKIMKEANSKNKDIYVITDETDDVDREDGDLCFSVVGKSVNFDYYTKTGDFVSNHPKNTNINMSDEFKKEVLSHINNFSGDVKSIEVKIESKFSKPYEKKSEKVAKLLLQTVVMSLDM